MSSSEFKLTLPRYDGRPDSDFQLWEIRLRAILTSKGLIHCIDSGSSQTNQDPPASEVTAAAAPNQQGTATATMHLTGHGTVDEKSRASAIIINGIGDKPLRVIQNQVGDPQKMLQKLQERYASSRVATRMSLMGELQALTYNGRGDMAEYVDKYAALVSRLDAMGAGLQDELIMTMFLGSVSERFPAIVAALRTMPDNLRWDDVTARLIEEAREHKKQSRSGHGMALVGREGKNKECSICKKKGHLPKVCWWNPDNPKNRLKGKSLPEGRAGAASQDEGQSKKTKSSKDRQEKSGASRLLVARASAASNRAETKVLLDSGASYHMCPDKSWFSNMKRIANQKILLGDDSELIASYSGDVTLETPGDDGGIQLIFQDVLYLPELQNMLISVKRLNDKHVYVKFEKNICLLLDANDDNRVLLEFAGTSDGLFWAPIVPAENVGNSNTGRAEAATAEKDKTAKSSMQSIENMWHQRLAHVGISTIRTLLSQGKLGDKLPDEDACKSCVMGKQTRDPFQGEFSDATSPGEIIHSDVAGPVLRTFSGFRYIVSFIDEYSRHVSVSLMKKKSEVCYHFRCFQRVFERRHGHSIKAIHSDNGGEYDPVEKYASSKGIQVTRAAPYTPQSNGIAERLNRTLFEAARTMLIESNLPKTFWGEAILHAVNVRNSIPRSGMKKSPDEILGLPSTLEKHRPFGCLAMSHIPEKKRKKIDPKSKSCIHFRALQHGNYKLYDPRKGTTFVSRHVKFFEGEFPGVSLKGHSATRDMELGEFSDIASSELEIDEADNSSENDSATSKSDTEESSSDSSDSPSDSTPYPVGQESHEITPTRHKYCRPAR